MHMLRVTGRLICCGSRPASSGVFAATEGCARRGREMRTTTAYRCISQSTPRLHGDHDKDQDFVILKHNAAKATPQAVNTLPPLLDDDDDEDDEDMVDTVAIGPSGIEYGGPTRGGTLKEPTRFGDWERKGRCTDF